MSAINKWTWVKIGGVSSLLLGGAGGMYASGAVDRIKAKIDNYNNDDNQSHIIEENEVAQQETELQVAYVSEDLNFSEAFAQAREDVGAGGVFYWHGGIYSTFYEEEWNNMTAEEKQEYGELANDIFPVPENHENAISPQLVENDIITLIDAKNEVSENDDIKQDVEKHILNKFTSVGEKDQQPVEFTDAEPQIVDYGTVGEHLAMSIDQDGDGVADYILVDVDDSKDITSDDLIVDRDGNVSTIGGEILGNLNEEPEDDMANNNMNEDTVEGDNELDIVGYGEYDGHLVVGYGSKGNDQADFVIIDVDDDGKPSADDVVITDDGQTTILGDIEAEDTQLGENPDNGVFDNFSDGIVSL